MCPRERRQAGISLLDFYPYTIHQNKNTLGKTFCLLQNSEDKIYFIRMLANLICLVRLSWWIAFLAVLNML